MSYAELAFQENAVFLVTGGAGFIGSNLCEAILKLGYQVRCLDDFSTGKRENVAPFLKDPRFTLLEGDVKEPDVCMRACEGVDYVLHQAARISVPQSIEAPLCYCANNIQGTLNMLEAACRNHAAKFVYASSSSVYGDSPGLPQREGQEGALLSPYALTKRCAEELGRQYALHYGLDTYGLRYFNVYGKRQDPNGGYAAVIPKFIRQLLAGERPTIYGDGEQSRDFTYVEDVVGANLKSCLAPHAAAGEVFNIACGERRSLLDLYRELTKALGVEIEPRFEPGRAGDIKHSCADIGKARSVLGYEPEWSFAKGIRATVAWYTEDLR